MLKFASFKIAGLPPRSRLDRHAVTPSSPNLSFDSSNGPVNSPDCTWKSFRSSHLRGLSDLVRVSALPPFLLILSLLVLRRANRRLGEILAGCILDRSFSCCWGNLCQIREMYFVELVGDADEAPRSLLCVRGVRCLIFWLPVINKSRTIPLLYEPP